MLIIRPFLKNVNTATVRKLTVSCITEFSIPVIFLDFLLKITIATHWLPNIIKEFQRDYPFIDYELLLGDYMEIEDWISEGRIDCGFIRLPTRPDFETVFIEKDEFMAVIPENHRYAGCDRFP